MTAIEYNNSMPYTRDLWRAIQRTVGAAVDGIPGPETATKIGLYQGAQGLSVDGKCGPLTLEDMGHSPFSFSDDGFTWAGKGSVCADGAPNAYRPGDTGLDYLANAGKPGNWWGIVTDESGLPVVQSPADPSPNSYVSQTAMARPGYEPHDQNRYIDASRIPYVVLPRNVEQLIPRSIYERLEKGDIARASYRGVTVIGIYAEVGPAWTLDVGTVHGELSIAALEGLGHDPWHHTAGLWRAKIGITSGVTYQVRVGTSHRTRIEDGACGQALAIDY
jgi:hypothetical protein